MACVIADHRTILRVEHAEDGQGPYWGPRDRWPDELCWQSYHRPMPRNVAPEDWHPKHGFDCQGEMRAWFPDDERRLLQRNGFRLSTYVVPTEHVIDDERQVIFNAKYAKRIADDAIPL